MADKQRAEGRRQRSAMKNTGDSEGVRKPRAGRGQRRRACRVGQEEGLEVSPI